MSTELLADRIAVQDVMLNYAIAVDERDRARYADCFCADVEVLNFGEGGYRGRNAWVEYVWQALELYRSTQHLLSPVLADIQGDVARAHTDVQASHLLLDGSRMVLLATYLSTLRRETDGWRISRHELVVRDLVKS